MSTATRQGGGTRIPWSEAEEKALCEGELRVRNGILPLNLPYEWDDVQWYIDARMREVNQGRVGLRTPIACQKHYEQERHKKFAGIVVDKVATANYIPPRLRPEYEKHYGTVAVEEANAKYLEENASEVSTSLQTVKRVIRRQKRTPEMHQALVDAQWKTGATQEEPWTWEDVLSYLIMYRGFKSYTKVVNIRSWWSTGSFNNMQPNPQATQGITPASMKARKEAAKVPADEKPSEEIFEESDQEDSSDDSEALEQLQQSMITNTGPHHVITTGGDDPFNDEIHRPPFPQNVSAERDRKVEENLGS